MGETLVDPVICGDIRCTKLKGVAVDTGALFTSVTDKLAGELGIERESLVDVELGDKRIVKRSTGTARITLDGRTSKIPVLIGDINVIGRTTLEILGFKIDPVIGKLESRPITT